MAENMPLVIKPTKANTSKSINVRVLEAKFGGGYSQRAGDGINTIERELNLSWVGSNTNINTLIDHFEERNGYQSFTINDATIADDITYKWICKTWNYEHLSDNVMSLSAKLIKVNDLV